MKIIGITGTLGAGKGTVVDYLVEQAGFTHYSVRQFLVEIIQSSGLIVNRDSMRQVANELRARYTPHYIIGALYEKASKQGSNAIIESIRTPGEIDFLQSQGNFTLIAVDADPKLRYERISLRKSATDSVDFDTFLANETREMSTTDPNKQNLQACIDRADIYLSNNGSREDLLEELKNKLAL